MSDSGYLETSRKQIELNDSVKLNLFGRVTCEPAWCGDLHSHDFWEIVYIVKTTQDPFLVRWEGGEHISGNSAIYLIPPQKKHQFENVGNIEAQNLYIGFSFSYSFEPEMMKLLPVVLPVDNAAVARLMAMLNEIAQPMDSAVLYEMMNRMRPEVMRRVIDLVKWVMETSQGGSGAIDRNQLLIDKIKEYLAENNDRNISVDELARQLYLSSNYLGQIFRQNTGTTVKNYHNKIRMEHALNILVSGEATISEVSDRVGFESVAYFSRRFKMFYGISPSSLYKADRTEETEDAQNL